MSGIVAPSSLLIAAARRAHASRPAHLHPAFRLPACPACLPACLPSPLACALQACLNTKAKPGTKAALRIRVDEGEPLLVCSLREGASESVGLDLIFDQ